MPLACVARRKRAHWQRDMVLALGFLEQVFLAQSPSVMAARQRMEQAAQAMYWSCVCVFLVRNLSPVFMFTSVGWCIGIGVGTASPHKPP
eukprot:517974-Alexandrium_andersonii.AAC.1